MRPTITDAFAACGMIGLAEVGYGAVTGDRERARAAITPLAEQPGLTVEQTAEAITRIAVSGMYSDVSGLVSRFGMGSRLPPDFCIERHLITKGLGETRFWCSRL